MRECRDIKLLIVFIEKKTFWYFSNEKSKTLCLANFFTLPATDRVIFLSKKQKQNTFEKVCRNRWGFFFSREVKRGTRAASNNVLVHLAAAGWRNIYKNAGWSNVCKCILPRQWNCLAPPTCLLPRAKKPPGDLTLQKRRTTLTDCAVRRA